MSMQAVKCARPSLRAHDDLITDEELESGGTSKTPKEALLAMCEAKGI